MQYKALYLIQVLNHLLPIGIYRLVVWLEDNLTERSRVSVSMEERYAESVSKRIACVIYTSLL